MLSLSKYKRIHLLIAFVLDGVVLRLDLHHLFGDAGGLDFLLLHEALADRHTEGATDTPRDHRFLF